MQFMQSIGSRSRHTDHHGTLLKKLSSVSYDFDELRRNDREWLALMVDELCLYDRNKDETILGDDLVNDTPGD